MQQRHSSQKHDFADSVSSMAARARREKRRPVLQTAATVMLDRRLHRGAIALSSVTLVLLGILALLAPAKVVDASISTEREEWLNAKLPEPEPFLVERREKLKVGDTAVAALSRLFFPATEVHDMIEAAEGVYPLRLVRAGKSFIRRQDGDADVVLYGIDSEQMLKLHADVADDGTKSWQAELVKRPVNSRRMVANGVISDSLIADAGKAGVDERTAMNLVDLFGWDIDFARDLREGDSFRIMYEESFDDEGNNVGSTILAAEFVNDGKSFQAIRYELADGRVDYFTPDGKSLRKSYLKAPVKFSRISSRFSLSRKHPVLGYNRAHRGVDYAAASGTPIRAVGDGTVTWVGWRGGYGRFVVIRHNNRNHSTAYAHMKGYGRGIRKGVRVRQGQVIGYVGMSGTATGPHLHFEFRVRDRAVNPLTVKRDPAKPVPKAEMVAFRAQAADQIAVLQRPVTLLAWR